MGQGHRQRGQPLVLGPWAKARAVSERVTAEPPEKTADDAFLPESEEASTEE